MAKAAFTKIERTISDYITRSEKSILIAVAWFTNKRLYNLLLEKLSEGVSVELIIRDDHVNNSDSDICLKWKEFLDLKGRLYFPLNSNTLHSKYCVIDGRAVISGSYNWTKQAEKANQENIVILEEKELTEAFAENFNQLKVISSLVQSSSTLNYRSSFDAPKEEQIIIEGEKEAGFADLELKNLLVEAERFYLNKQYDNAVRLSERILSNYKQDPLASEILAMSKVRQGDFHGALSAAESGLKENPDYAELHNVLGLAYHGVGEYGMAVRSFDEAIRRMPDATDFYMNKVISLYKSGREHLYKTASLELMKVASAIVRKPEAYPLVSVLHAYINVASTKEARAEQEKYAKKALDHYWKIPEHDRDLHDLDDINNILRP